MPCDDTTKDFVEHALMYEAAVAARNSSRMSSVRSAQAREFIRMLLIASTVGFVATCPRPSNRDPAIVAVSHNFDTPTVASHAAVHTIKGMGATVMTIVTTQSDQIAAAIETSSSNAFSRRFFSAEAHDHGFPFFPSEAARSTFNMKARDRFEIGG